jgi:4-carboxymuconolactone decarboxylase
MTTPTPQPIPARIYAAVPQLARIRRDVLLADVWQQPEMAYRDRILVTLGVLAAGGKVDEMEVWMARALENGLTLNDLRGLIVQVTFYAGWPAGLAAGRAALPLFEADDRAKATSP